MTKNRFVIPLIAFALLVAVLAIGVMRSPEKQTIKSVLIGKPAPQFNLPSLTSPSTVVTSQELHGKPYVLNVWGTWCPMCRVEHPELMRIQQLGQVPIVGLNWRDEDGPALDWLKELGNPYEHVAVDKSGRTAIDLGVYGAPETFLIDGNGVIVHKHVGPMSVEIWKRDFEPKLGSSSTAAPNAPGAAGATGAGPS